MTLDEGDPTSIQSVDYQDPITNAVDPRVQGFINTFLAEGVYPSMPVASAREMHLILAEAALATNNQGDFNMHINHARSMSSLPDFTGQIDNRAMLIHERAANLFGMNRRLTDMYRFGIQSASWRAGSEAMTSVGTYLPISCTEVRANPNVENNRC